MDEKVRRILDLIRAHRQAAENIGQAHGTAGPLREGRPPVAIIGLAGYLPESPSVAEFWRALDQDRPCIREIPKQRFDWRAIHDPSANNPARSCTKWGGFIPEIEEFDPDLFGIAAS